MQSFEEASAMSVGAQESDELVQSLKALLIAARQGRQVLAEVHRDVPVSLISLLDQIDRAIEGTGGPEGHPPTGCRLKDVAARARLDPSTISREIAQLIALGLVERRIDQTDRRSARLAVTPAGHARLARFRAAMGALLVDAVSGWRPEEVRDFTRSMRRFADALTDHLQAVSAARSPMTESLSIQAHTPQGVAR